MNLVIHIIFFLFGFVSLISTQNLTDVELDSRIVGGIAIKVNIRKFQVALLSQYLCGGSLIQYRWVLTAAHCLVGMKPTDLIVRAGSTYASKGGVIGKTKRIIKHKLYNPNTMNYDIGLVQTQGSFKPFTSKYPINIIALLTKLPADGSLMSVTGFGALYSNGPLPPTLRKVNVRKINYVDCNTKYGKELTSTMFCAAAKGKDSCQGDSGGPIVYNGHLAGVVSWGNGCADPKYPGIYTSVPRLRNWIWQKLKRFG